MARTSAAHSRRSSRVVAKRRPLGTAPRQWPERPMRCKATEIDRGEPIWQTRSPRSISVALQRIGRAGHWRGAVPKGRLFATTRDDLLECAALVRAIRQGDLDRIAIPEAPMDILAQQIVAACAAEDWQED